VTEATFYIFQQGTPAERPVYACRLAETAYSQGHAVYLNTPSEAAARALDELLWSFCPHSFLPHGLIGSADAERIGIGWGADPGGHHDVMINLDLQVPEFVGRFQRALEIVVPAPEIREPLRSSWRRYQHYGYPIVSHEL
jgi:DNA polymerase-3 subunit chi